MARTIDEKVVEMRFDNQNFESNVAQSMSTLDKLKSALNFSGMENAFSGISSAADKVNFNGLSGALDGVTEKFSALEAVAVGALMNIGAKISDLAIKTAKELTIDQVTAGFDKYAKKTEAVQMIMNATGMEIEDVSNQLERLNWYTDETSYDFAEMTASIGKFTAAGIDLETAVTSMQGIANWAGVSGANKAEANRAMYNISQALSTGYMQKIDWKSIENANMATKEFKEMVIQAGLALGTLEEFEGKVGVVEDAIWNAEKGIYEGGTLTFVDEWINGVTFSNMASTLSKGKWLTNEVLTEVLDKYGAFTNELSDVYDELNEEVDITTSEIIKLTNEWIDNTIDWDEACAMTGKTAEELEAILSSLGREEYTLGRKAFAAAQEAKTFREAIDATKDAVSTGFMNVFEQLFGNYEEAKVLWTDLANELWDIFASPISDLNDMLKAWNHIEMPDGTIIKGRDVFIQSIKDIYHAIRSVVDPITEAWEAIFPSMDFRKLFELTTQFQKFTSGLELNEEAMDKVYTVAESIFRSFSLIGDILKSVLVPFFEELTGFGKDLDGGFFEIIASFGEWLNGLIDSIRGSEKFLDFMSRIRTTAREVGEAIHYMFRPGDIASYFSEYGGIGGAFTSLISVLQHANEAFAYVAQAITGNHGILPAVNKLNDKLRDTQEKIITVIDTFENKFGKIREIFQPLIEAAKTIGSDFLQGLGMIFEDLAGSAISSVDSLNAWLDVANQMIEESPEIANFVSNLKEIVQEIGDFFVHMLSLKDAVQIFRDAGGGIEGLFAVLDDRVTYLVDSLFDAIERLTGIDLHYVGDNIMLVLHAIGEGVLWLADTIAKAFGWENNPFGIMLESSSGALDTLKEKIKSLLGGEDSSFKISDAFKRIGDALKSFWGVIQDVSPAIGSALGIVGKVVEWLVEQLTKLSLNDVFKLIMLGELAYLLKNFSWVLEGLSEVLEGFGLKLKAEAIRNIALSIIMVAGAAILLATIPTEKMTGVIIALGTAFAGLVGVLIASKFAGKTGGLPILIASTALALMAFASAMNKLAEPIERFGKMDIVELVKGFGAIAVALIEVGVAVAVLGKLRSKALAGATSLKSVAMALTITWAAIELFSLIDWSTLLDSLTKIAAVLGVVGGIIIVGEALSTLLSVLTGVVGLKADFGIAVKQIAEALIFLSGALYIVSKIDNYWDSLLKMAAALAVVAAISAVLAPCAKALKIFTEAISNLAKGLVALSAGLLILGLIEEIFGEQIDELIDSGINLLIRTFDRLTERVPELYESISGFVSAIITEIAKSFEGADPQPIITSAAALGAGIAAVLALKFFGPKTKDFLKTGWTIIEVLILYAEIIAGFAALGYAINALKDKAGFDVAAEIVKFGETAELIADIMFSKVGLLLVAASALTLIYDKLGSSPSASGFGKVVLIIGEAAGVIEAMGLIFAALGGFTDWIQELSGGGDTYVIDMINLFGDVAEAVADVVGRVAEKLIGGVVRGSIEGFTDGTVYMIEELSKVTEDLSAFDDDAISGIKNFGKFILLMSGADLLVGIETLCSFGANVIGSMVSKTMMSDFKTMIETFVGLSDSFDEFKEDSLDKAKKFVDLMLIIANADLLTGVETFLSLGANVLGSYTSKTQFKNFGAAVTNFVTEISSLDETSLNKATICVGILSTLLESVPVTENSILDLLIGDGRKDFGQFGEQLKNLGEGLKSFQESTKDVDAGVVGKAKGCVGMLAALSTEIPVTGRSVIDLLIGEGKKDFGVFGDQLAALGTGLNTFQQNTSSLDSGIINRAAACASTLAALSTEIPVTSRSLLDILVGEGGKNLGSFGRQLSNLGYYMLAFQNETAGLDQSKIYAAANCANILITQIAQEIPETSGSWWDHLWGNDNSLGSFGTNLVSFGKNFYDYYDAINSISVERLTGLNGAIKETVTMLSELDVGEVTDSAGSLTEKIKTAATNLVGKIKDSFTNAMNADEGPKTKVQEFLDAIIDVMYKPEVQANMYSAGENLFTSIGEGLTFGGTMSKYELIFYSYINDLWQTAGGSDMMNNFKLAGYNLLKTFHEGLLYENLVASTIGDFNAFLDSIKSLIDSSERLEQFSEAGRLLLNAVIDGFTDPANLNSAELAFNSFMNSLSGTIMSSESISKFENAGQTLGSAIASGVGNQNVQQKIKEAGNYVAEGLAVGMTDSSKKIKDAATQMADTVIQTTRTVLDINSPSWTMKILGLFTGEGFASGIWESIPNVQEKVHALGESVIDGISNSDVVSKMKEIGLLGSGSMAEGLGSKLEAIFNIGDLLGEAATDGAASNLYNAFWEGEDVWKFFENGLSSGADELYNYDDETVTDFLSSMFTDYEDLYGKKGEEAVSLFNDSLIAKYAETYDAGALVSSAGAEGALSTYSDYVDASETSSAGIVDGLASYGKGGKNEDKTEAAADAVVDKVVDSIEDNDGKMRSEGDKEAEEWQEGFIENGGWDTLGDEIKEKLGGALSGLYGYKLDEEGALRRVNKSGEYVDFEEVPGSVITWSGTQGTIKSYVQNGVTGYNSSGSYSVASAAAAQNAMNRNLYNSEYIRSGDDEDDRIYQEVKKLNENMAEYNENITNMQIVMDTGVVAGEVSPAVNQNLGKTSWYSSRGI